MARKDKKKERIVGTIKIRCHGCKKNLTAPVLKQWYLPNRPLKPVDKSDPQYAIYGRIRIPEHKRGWFKPRCNRSGKTFKMRVGTTPSCQAGF